MKSTILFIFLVILAATSLCADFRDEMKSWAATKEDVSAQDVKDWVDGQRDAEIDFGSESTYYLTCNNWARYVAVLNDTQFAVFSANSQRTWRTYVGTISGTSITFGPQRYITYNSSYNFDTLNTDVVALDETHVIVAMRRDDSERYIYLFSYEIVSDMVIYRQYGTHYAPEDGATGPKLGRINDDYGLLIYNTDTGNYGTVFYLNSSNYISLYSETSLNLGYKVKDLQFAMMTDSFFFVAGHYKYYDTSTPQNIYGVVGQISGSSISVGNGSLVMQNVSNDYSTLRKVLRLTPTKAVVLFEHMNRDGGGRNRDIAAREVNIYTTTFTVGASAVVTRYDGVTTYPLTYPYLRDACIVNSERMVLFYSYENMDDTKFITLDLTSSGEFEVGPVVEFDQSMRLFEGQVGVNLFQMSENLTVFNYGLSTDNYGRCMTMTHSDPPPPPSTATLLYPVNNATGLPRDVTVQWEYNGTSIPMIFYVYKYSDTYEYIGYYYWQGYTTYSMVMPTADYGEVVHWMVESYNEGGWAPTAYGTYTTIWLPDPPSSPTNLFPENGAFDMPRQVTVNWRYDGEADVTGFRVYKDDTQVGSDIAWAGDQNYYQQMPLANWDEVVNWYIVSYNDGGDCTSPVTWSYTTMSEPADPDEVPDEVVYEELENVTVTEPPVVTLPPITLGGSSVQPTFDFTFNSAPDIPVLSCQVMDLPAHPVGNPSGCGAAFTATFPVGIATTLTFDAGISSTPTELYRWNGSLWEDISGTATFGVGTVTFTHTSTSRADEEFIINDGEGTLPVTLSSFTASVTASDFVMLQWITESESEMLGYNVHRSETESLEDALRVNAQCIQANNSSTQSEYSFIDEDVEYDMTYTYWLESMELNGQTRFYGPVTVILTEDEEEENTPDANYSTAFLSAYPNPFNPVTTLSYSIVNAGMVEFTMFDMKGRKVGQLSHNGQKGRNTLVWDAGNLPSGLYFIRMKAGDLEETRKVMLLK